LEDWLSGQSEIMILVRYSRAAGSKSFEFFSSFTALKLRLAQLKAETSVTAFRKPGDRMMRMERDAMNDTGELRPVRGTGSCLPTIHPEQKRESTGRLCTDVVSL
jgi:hypothetical protein